MAERAACAAVPRPGGRPVEPSADAIVLTREQLLINQRIGQAAIRRIAAVEQRLRGGLQDRDVCGGTISAQSARLHPDAEPTAPRSPCPRARAPADHHRAALRRPRQGAGSRAQQLLINQRIYQVALLRGRALAARLGGRLTGGDMDAGALTRGRLTPGLTLTAAGAATSSPPSSSKARIPRSSPRRRG